MEAREITNAITFEKDLKELQEIRLASLTSIFEVSEVFLKDHMQIYSKPQLENRQSAWHKDRVIKFQ